MPCLQQGHDRHDIGIVFNAMQAEFFRLLNHGFDQSHSPRRLSAYTETPPEQGTGPEGHLIVRQIFQISDDFFVSFYSLSHPALPAKEINAHQRGLFEQFFFADILSQFPGPLVEGRRFFKIAFTPTHNVPVDHIYFGFPLSILEADSQSAGAFQIGFFLFRTDQILPGRCEA